MNKNVIGLLLALGAIKAMVDTMEKAQENRNSATLVDRLNDTFSNVKNENKDIRNQAKIELIQIAEEMRGMVDERSIDYMFLSAMIENKSFSKSYLMQLAERLTETETNEPQEEIKEILDELDNIDAQIIQLKGQRQELLDLLSEIDNEENQLKRRKRELFDMIAKLQGRA